MVHSMVKALFLAAVLFGHLKISRALSQWFLSVDFPGAWFSMGSGFFVMKRIVWTSNFS